MRGCDWLKLKILFIKRNNLKITSAVDAKFASLPSPCCHGGWTQNLHLSPMSKGYKQAKAIAGLSCPAHMNKQVWARYQAVAKDPRLASIYTHNLPDSYVSLYELTRMPTPLLEAVARSGLLNSRTPYRLLRKIRISGKLPI